MGEVQNNAKENETVNEDVMRAEKIAQAKGEGKSHADAVEAATGITGDNTPTGATSDSPNGSGEQVHAGSDSEPLSETEVDEVLDQAENADETDGAK